MSNHSLADDLPTFFIKDDTQPAIGLADSSPGWLSAESLLLLLRLPITDRLGPLFLFLRPLIILVDLVWLLLIVDLCMLQASCLNLQTT